MVWPQSPGLPDTYTNEGTNMMKWVKPILAALLFYGALCVIEYYFGKSVALIIAAFALGYAVAKGVEIKISHS
jgi:hypothetical protein